MTTSSPHWSEQAEKAAALLSSRLGAAPKAAVVLGSGLALTGERLTEGAQVRELGFAEIPGVPVPAVAGHGGKLRLAKEKDLVIVAGRSHLYEGRSPGEVVLLVRALVRWGVKTVVLTNASGSLKAEIKPGSIVAIEDHINFTGVNPLTGPHREGFGERFPDMSRAYDVRLRKLARRGARRLGLRLRSDVYIQVQGPSYETPAEVSAFARLGAGIVGMSTAIETIAARDLGARVLGLSVVTNYAGGRGGTLSHEEVIRQSREAGEKLAALIAETLRLDAEPPPRADRPRP